MASTSAAAAGGGDPAHAAVAEEARFCEVEIFSTRVALEAAKEQLCALERGAPAAEGRPDQRIDALRLRVQNLQASLAALRRREDALRHDYFDRLFRGLGKRSMEATRPESPAAGAAASHWTRSSPRNRLEVLARKPISGMPAASAGPLREAPSTASMHFKRRRMSAPRPLQQASLLGSDFSAGQLSSASARLAHLFKNALPPSSASPPATTDLSANGAGSTAATLTALLASASAAPSTTVQTTTVQTTPPTSSSAVNGTAPTSSTSTAKALNARSLLDEARSNEASTCAPTQPRSAEHTPSPSDSHTDASPVHSRASTPLAAVPGVLVDSEGVELDQCSNLRELVAGSNIGIAGWTTKFLVTKVDLDRACAVVKLVNAGTVRGVRPAVEEDVAQSLCSLGNGLLPVVAETRMTRPGNRSSPPRTPSQVVCSCRKSKCLKLYCQCFSGNNYCTAACQCQQCLNTQNFPEERALAVRMSVARSPGMWSEQRLRKTSETASLASDHRVRDAPEELLDNGEVQRSLGRCRCRRSACLKKYCVCFSALKPCTSACSCTKCANV